MEISTVIADAIAVQAPAISRFLLPQHSPTLSILAAAALPVDALASPATVRSDPCRPAPRALARRTRRRTRRRSLTDDGGEDGLSGDGDGDDGPFGGGGGGGGGGWGFGGRGGSNWEGSGPPFSSSPDPAFDFVYEVMCWIALSNCAHFAVKRLGRLLSGREKEVPLRLVPSIC